MRGTLARTTVTPSHLVMVARPLAAAAMLACIASSIAQIGMAINPTWPGKVWVGLVFVISLESMSAYRLLEARQVGSRDRGRFRFVEWVVILLLVRLALYVGKPAGTLARDVAAWSEHLELFLGGGFILAAVLIACFWAAALFLGQTLAELDASSYELHEASSEVERYLWQTMPRHGRRDRSVLLKRLSGFFLGGGVLVVLLAGLARVDVTDIVLLQHGRTSGPILNVLLYFAIGLLIISQAQYAALKAGWDMERLPVWDDIGKRWVIATVAFLLLVGTISALLPVGYSIGLLATIGALIQWAAYILMQILMAIVFVFGLILALIMHLFTGKPVDTSFELQTPPALPTEAAASGGGPSSWWPIVKSLLFWAALIGVVAYSMFIFARDRWGWFRGWSLSRWLRRLFGFARDLQKGLKESIDRMRQGLSRLRVSRATEEGRQSRFLSIGRLSSRDRVRYFYLSTLRRASSVGFGRRPAQTPLEYQAVLLAATTEADSADTLTDAFLSAQYSSANVTPDDAQRAKSAWQNLKRRLTRRARGKVAA